MYNYRSNLKIILFLGLLALVSACSAGQSSPSAAAKRVEPKDMKNPYPPTAQSIANGKRLFLRLCADCHGEAGNGVSEMAKTLAQSGKTPPPDLTDDKWDHGTTDGEIFVEIR